MLNIKNWVFKKRPARKLPEQYIDSYIIEEVVSANIVKLKLPLSIINYLVVNISKVVRYRKLVKV